MKTVMKTGFPMLQRKMLQKTEVKQVFLYTMLALCFILIQYLEVLWSHGPFIWIPRHLSCRCVFCEHCLLYLPVLWTAQFCSILAGYKGDRLLSRPSWQQCQDLFLSDLIFVCLEQEGKKWWTKSGKEVKNMLLERGPGSCRIKLPASRSF